MVVNGETPTRASAITEGIYEEMLASGAGRRNARQPFLESEGGLAIHRHSPRLVRPINYLKAHQGADTLIVETKNGQQAW